MSSNLRKWAGVFLTAFCYYLVHEGAHLITALFMGSFERVKLVFPGIQVVANTDAMSDLQIAVFSIVGALATIIAGYMLILLTGLILQLKNKVAKVAFYYITLGMLLCDPIYLSVLCGFFGGGDMNGIVLFGIPELAARIVFGVIGVVNLRMFVKRVYPLYKADFSKSCQCPYHRRLHV